MYDLIKSNRKLRTKVTCVIIPRAGNPTKRRKVMKRYIILCLTVIVSVGMSFGQINKKQSDDIILEYIENNGKLTLSYDDATIIEAPFDMKEDASLDITNK